MSPAATSDTAPAEEPKVADLDAVLQLLPACRRCRRNKRRCDIRLPACLNCSRVGAECIFFDHVSKELLPRTYIASLVDHLRALEATSASATAGATAGASPSAPTSTSTSTSLTRPAEHHFIHVHGAYRYLGVRAPLAVQDDRIVISSPELRANATCPPLVVPPQSLMGSGMHQFLVSCYLETLHGLYPVLDAALVYLTEPPTSLSDLAASESFMLHMVYSIACHCLRANDCQLVLLSDSFYREALVHAEKITAELNLDALQAVLLLALRSLFDAQNGSLGQQIAFAHRLEVELGAREVEESTPALQQLRASIFCIGNQVASALDRPSGLVEWEATAFSDKPDGSQLLCHLYRVQSSFRRGSSFDELHLDGVEQKIMAHGSPLLVAALNETRFLLEPNVDSAMQLLSTYASDNMILNVFTSHWTYKAATFFLGDDLDKATLQGRALAQKVLERCALKWPNARALQDSVNVYSSG
ncbi:hypothetical protein A1O3_01357 [Capronia epimyces CBS 606.96]|uniref:Zn(2)-C6 fungal-type domain-containing protein n=1 Tax=Capronia epimyces CBS 606.96 TaxID=1182542 RepID=W9YJS3_9EURO|nr:uncharacterized protein A1O3_01357 [Capronia epimyces CBS 606.96]EXJ92803.1 hypothetical protein A1O3_01357 [Capronia epimyces CBS 606.96]